MHSGAFPVCCYSLFMNRKRIKNVALRSLAIVLAMLFDSLLAQRLFHPR